MPQTRGWLFRSARWLTSWKSRWPTRSAPELALVLTSAAGAASLVLAAAVLIFWAESAPLTIVVVCSVLLAVTLLVYAVLSPSALDRGLSGADIRALAKLSGPGEGADRGTEGAKTYYTWREDQWRQISRGLGALAASLIIAVLAGVVATVETTTSTETKPPSAGSPTPTPTVQGTTPKSPGAPNAAPATQATAAAASPSPLAVTTKRTVKPVPAAIWVVLVNLVILAGFAAARSRQAHRDFANDLRRIAESP